MSKVRLKGKVIKNKMDKTVVVEVERKTAHPKYKKILTRKKKYYVHTEEKLDIGDEVTIELVRPISKTKRWRVIDNISKKDRKK